MCIELHVAEKRILTRQSYMKLFNKSSWQTVRLCQDRILKWFTTPTVLSLRLKQDEFEWGRYFPAPPPVSTAVQESQNPSFKVKFTQDTAVQYLHKTTIKLQQNTIDRSPPPFHFPHSTLTPQPSSQHFDAIIFLLSRWFSKTLKHHPTCAITRFIRQQRNISPFHT